MNPWIFHESDSARLSALEPGDAIYTRLHTGSRIAVRRELVIRKRIKTLTCERGTYRMDNGEPWGRKTGFRAYPITAERAQAFDAHRRKAQALRFLKGVQWSGLDEPTLTAIVGAILRAQEKSR